MLEQALGNVDKTIRKKIIENYLDLKGHLTSKRHDSAGVSAGKMCEAVIRHLQKQAFGQNTKFGKHIPNFADECRKIVQCPSTSPITDSERKVVTRSLVFLYTMRNTRGIGHVGGDVDANAIDAATMGRVADWIICELIRVYHGLSLEEAQGIVDALAIRQVPDVWEVAGKKRVLRKDVAAWEKVLLLLYSEENSEVLIEDLFNWVEYGRMDHFKDRVIRKLHNDLLVNWDRESDVIVLSPLGASHVEESILQTNF